MHHHRRKSGHGSNNTSLTDVRKAVTVSDLSSKHKSSTTRPGMVRRTTPQTVQKLGKNPRDREREWEEERWFDEERESFPQFCMTCEKQFVPEDALNLFCSEACRIRDQSVEPPPMRCSSRAGPASYPYYSDHAEPRDIIPRASPSRPSSTSFSPPATPPSSAISALRSLSVRPPSPPSPVGNYQTTLWPFTSTRSAAASPNTYYSRPVSGFFSSTFDEAYYSSTMGGTTKDKPLPSRRPGHTYSRPKSIELVTPR